MAKQPRKNTGRVKGQGQPSGSSSAQAARVEPGAPGSRAARRPESVRQRKEARQKAAAREQRNKSLVRIGAVVVGALLLVALAIPIYNQFAGPDVSGEVTTYFSAEDFVGVHPNDVTEILYEEVPPVGGPHNAVWQNCGFYDKYIFNWHGVHALEHGAVWLTYDPNLSQEDKDTLEKKADQGYVLISPYPGLGAPVVGSVWGKQMKFDGVNDDRIDAFIKQYRKNPSNTPEQGAVCWGGTSITTDQEPQQQPFKQADASLPPIGGIKAIDVTATAQAQQAPAATPPPASTPVASPVASPQATPEGSPEASASPAS